jgi:hypothetical protein
VWDVANIGESSIAMGNNTMAKGIFSTAMGDYTWAEGDGSTTLGGFVRATSNAKGSFIYGDRSVDVFGVLTVDQPNQFVVRATNGVFFYTKKDLASGVELKPGGNSWGSVSDRNRKEFFRPVDGDDFLRRVAVLPLTSWSYKGTDPGRRYIGPMAQDFHALFGLGDDTTITTHDMDGVTLVAVQALGTRTESLRQENVALRNELAATKRAYAAILRRVERLEAAHKP